MRFVLVLLLCLLPLFAAAGEDNYDKVLEQFERRMKRKDLDQRAAGIRLLDPNNARSLEPLKKLLTEEHWFMRGRAAEALANVTDEALRADLRLELITNEEIWVREGIALAFTLSPVKGDAEALVEALHDDAWEVRRQAATALAGIVSRESLEALVAAMQRETDPRVSVPIADTLRKLTGRNYGRDGAAWLLWWKKNKDRGEIGDLGDEEVKRRKLGGIPIETVTVPTRRPGAGEPKKDPIDFLVLAPFGWTHDVYRPWLDELTLYGRVTYVNLPRVSELTGSSGFGASVPTYPVGKLVKALEELREELGKRRVVVLGEGATGWIAERYAITHRKRTAGLIILNGYVDAASYAAALGRLARSPVPAERWVAETLMGRNSIPHDQAAYRRIVRIMLTADLAEPRDSRAYLLWKDAQDPQGFATVPDIRFPDRAKLEVPTLFYFGTRSRLSGFPEAERIRKHFPLNILGTMLKSRGFPYVTEYDEFYRILEGFLGHYGLR